MENTITDIIALARAQKQGLAELAAAGPKTVLLNFSAKAFEIAHASKQDDHPYLESVKKFQGALSELKNKEYAGVETAAKAYEASQTPDTEAAVLAAAKTLETALDAKHLHYAKHYRYAHEESPEKNIADRMQIPWSKAPTRPGTNWKMH